MICNTTNQEKKSFNELLLYLSDEKLCECGERPDMALWVDVSETPFVNTKTFCEALVTKTMYPSQMVEVKTQTKQTITNPPSVTATSTTSALVQPTQANQLRNNHAVKHTSLWLHLIRDVIQYLLF
jgi:hypothetical protein